MPQKYAKSEDTRKKIYNAAIILMLRQGYDTTTIRQICKESGVSIGTFYQYFKTKNDLLRDFFLASDRYFTPMLEYDFKEHTAVDLYNEFIERRTKLEVDSGLDIVKLLTNVNNKLSSERRVLRSVLEKIISYGQESGEFIDTYNYSDLADIVLNVIHGISLQWCITDGAFDIASKYKTASEILLLAFQKTKS